MRTVIFAVLLAAPLAASAQDTLRCGNEIVRIGMTMDEVMQQCGKPSSTGIVEQDVRAGPRVIGKTRIHVWTYERRAGQRTAILEFDQDELKVIQYVSK